MVLRSFSIPSPRVWLALCKICQGTLSEKFTCFDLDPPAQLLFIVSIREEGKAGPLSLVGRNSPKTHQLPASSVPLGFVIFVAHHSPALPFFLEEGSSSGRGILCYLVTLEGKQAH